MLLIIATSRGEYDSYMEEIVRILDIEVEEGVTSDKLREDWIKHIINVLSEKYNINVDKEKFWIYEETKKPLSINDATIRRKLMEEIPLIKWIENNFKINKEYTNKDFIYEII